MISVWCSGASGETERDERGERLEGEGIHCDPCIVNSSSVPGRDKRQREKGRERCGAGGLEEDLFTGKEICLGMDWTAVQPEPELFADANVWTLSQLPECHPHSHLSLSLSLPLLPSFTHCDLPPVYDTASTSDAPFAVVLRIVARARAPLRPL